LEQLIEVEDTHRRRLGSGRNKGQTRVSRIFLARGFYRNPGFDRAPGGGIWRRSAFGGYSKSIRVNRLPSGAGANPEVGAAAAGRRGVADETADEDGLAVLGRQLGRDLDRGRVGDAVQRDRPLLTSGCVSIVMWPVRSTTSAALKPGYRSS
jgi:hypothetical protein